MKPWSQTDIPSLRHKRIIVTGATSGIGWNTALELARAGADVTIPARSLSKAQDAAARISEAVPNAPLEVAVLDLESFDSIRQFAAAQLSEQRPIDALINNAGIMAVPTRVVDADGFERQFATNVLGPFLLTGLLLPMILKAAAPRVVNVSSGAHAKGGPVPLEDLNSERNYKPMEVYAKTKLAILLFTCELQRRFPNQLLAISCHPGIVRTNIAANTSNLIRAILWVLTPLMQSPENGAEAALFAATGAGVKPAAYYGPERVTGGPIKDTRMAPFAYDETAARRLFDELEQLTGFHYPPAKEHRYDH
jgi:NAD(P)-dependent dehydrogenase (short-subunit alcohol dehydrogenase family)